MNVQVHRHRGMSRSMVRRCGHVLATRRHGGLHHPRGGSRMVTSEHGPPVETRCARHRRRMLQLEGSVTSAGTTDDTTTGCASGTSAASAVHPPPFHHECRWYLRRVADVSRALPSATIHTTNAAIALSLLLLSHLHCACRMSRVSFTLYTHPRRPHTTPVPPVAVPRAGAPAFDPRRRDHVGRASLFSDRRSFDRRRRTTDRPVVPLIRDGRGTPVYAAVDAYRRARVAWQPPSW